MKNIIALIPARSGSKGIKNKNIKQLKKKPLIGLAIEQCFKSKLFSKIYVSTDSIRYAEIAKKHGSVDIIMRPKKISNDKSTDYEMVDHAIKNITSKYDFIAHIRPTSPLRKVEHLKKAIKIFINSNYDSLRSVHEMQESSYKTFEMKNGFLKPLNNINLSIDQLNAPRQNFAKTFFPNGIIDIYRKNFILRNKLLFGKNVKAFVTPFCQEVDTIEDFKYIKFLWKE
jgi:CMP-N,N'-diacetyllegionaminic acid synthase